jgi:hypothetical protein
MKTQIVYETNLDYEASYESLAQSYIAVVDKTRKELISVKFKGTRTIFIISPKGKIQVLWKDVAEKKVLFKVLCNLLVPKAGETLKIKPTIQQAMIPYPPPSNFKLYWCDEETKYAKDSLSAKVKSVAHTIGEIAKAVLSYEIEVP